jgi:2,3-bisphosphoglycerate-dependent phosphoglycerate mutase
VGTLILLRHGQSTYNAENRFTGWVDSSLTDQGREEARKAAEVLASEGLAPDIVVTSVLERAITTAEVLLHELGRSWIPVLRSWRLNERHYGALQGLNKAETAERYGEEQVRLWRRSYDVRPPATDEQAQRELWADERYRRLPLELVPRTESLADVIQRVLPYYFDVVVPLLWEDHTVLVSAHGNSLRGLVKVLRGLDDDEVVSLEIANGEPLVFQVP